MQDDIFSSVIGEDERKMLLDRLRISSNNMAISVLANRFLTATKWADEVLMINRMLDKPTEEDIR